VEVSLVKLIDILDFAWSGMRDRKLRTALTILGIVIGSSLIVALISSTQGLSTGITERVSRMGVTTISVFSVNPTLRLTDEDVMRIERVEGVKTVIPFYRVFAKVSCGEKTLDQIQVLGIDPEKLFELLNGLELESGKTPSSLDQARAIIGYTVANPPDLDTKFADLNHVINIEVNVFRRGRILKITHPFLVSGVLKQYGATMLGDIDNTVFITPLAAKSMVKRTHYSGLFIIAESLDDVDPIVKSLTDMYGRKVRVISPSTILQNVQQILYQQTVFLGSIAAISLIVAGVGIMNTAYVSVMERTREIGILKAIGFKKRTIMILFLSESVLTGLIGGVIGVAFGCILALSMGNILPRFRPPAPKRMVGGHVQLPVQISPELLIFTVLFTVAIAVLAGVYPAWKASKLDPVAALKHE